MYSMQVLTGCLKSLESKHVARRFVRAARVMGVLSCVAFAGQIQAASYLLQPPSQQVVFPAGSNGGVSLVSNGYLLTYLRDSGAHGVNPLRLVPLRDGKQQTVQLSLAQKDVYIEDASVAPNGHVLVAGWYVRSSDGTQKNFFASLDPAGKDSYMIDAGRYTPERICGSADGSIWTFGQDNAAELSDPVQNYAMLRKFSVTGSPQGEFLDRSLLPNEIHVNLHQAGRVTSGFLSCGDTSVGAYVGLQGTGVGYWAEIERSGTAVQLSRVAIISNFKISGLSLLGPNTVYASFTGLGGSERRLYTLSINGNGMASWTPVSLPATSSAGFLRVLGRDGFSLASPGAQAHAQQRV